MALSGHRLASVEAVELVTRYPRTVGRNARLGSHGSGPRQTALIVRTDKGAVGWGLASGRIEGLDSLVGKPIDGLFDLEVGVVDQAAMPLDFALHDLVGRILDQPVYELLGARGDTSVTCYDGAIYFDDLDPDNAPRGLDVVLGNCAADHAAGYRAFKLKIGRGNRWMSPEAGLARDIEVTKAVRAAYPDCRVLVDANDGYSCAGLLDYLDAVGDCELFWIEEPFAENADDLGQLRAYLNRTGAATLIADGEFEPDEPGLLELCEAGLLDVLLMDVVSYGLTEWRRVMGRLETLGVHASPHAWGLPLKTLYAGQIAAGLGNVLTVEGVPGETDGVDASGYRLENGVLHVPDAPGFGIELDALTPSRAEGLRGSA